MATSFSSLILLMAKESSNFKMVRGRGTGEASEAAASPEIQRLTKLNTNFSLPEKNHIL